MNEDQVKIQLREKQTELIKISEAIANLEKNSDWQTLVEMIFNKSLVSIERQLLNESLSLTLNDPKLYRLQGEWAWAKQYCDIKRLGEQIKVQLSDIKQKLNE